jgi:hypothetical protein
VEKKGVVSRIREAVGRLPVSGFASPNPDTVYDVPVVPLLDCWELYKRDTTCRSAVDELAASLVGMGFYTTCASEADYVDAQKAKNVVDVFCGSAPKGINLDRMLFRMAKRLIACGNVFWLKVSETEIVRLPLDAIEKIGIENLNENDIKIPYKVTSFKLRSKYGGGLLKPERIIHWKLEEDDESSGFGLGLMQTLLLTLTIQGNEKRPSYASMKAKIETVLPKVFEKWIGPDVLAYIPGASEADIRKWESAVKNRKKEGNWLFYGGKLSKDLPQPSLSPVQIDPRGQFGGFIEYMVNQFYLGTETPLPRLFSTPGFTEASANAAKELQDLLIRPVQRDIKRTVESEVFASAVRAAGLDPVLASVRLNWGSPEQPEMLMSDLIAAAGQGLIRGEEFRKNAVKAGWELWEPKPPAVGQGNVGSNASGGVGR